MAPFVYLASVCRCLQCLISGLTAGAEVVSSSGSPVQSRCGACGAGGALQTDVPACVGSARSVSGHAGPAPAHGAVLSHLHCSGSRLLCMERALHCLWFQFSGPPQKRSLGWACVLCLPRRGAQAARSLTGALSPVRRTSFPSAAPASVSAGASRVRAPCVCSGELVSSRDPPGRCQPSRISGSLWLETGGLFAVW